MTAGQEGVAYICDCCGSDCCPMMAGVSVSCAGGSTCACYPPLAPHPGQAVRGSVASDRDAGLSLSESSGLATPGANATPLPAPESTEFVSFNGAAISDQAFFSHRPKAASESSKPPTYDDLGHVDGCARDLAFNEWDCVPGCKATLPRAELKALLNRAVPGADYLAAKLNPNSAPLPIAALATSSVASAVPETGRSASAAKGEPHKPGCAYLTQDPLSGDEGALCSCGAERLAFERWSEAQVAQTKGEPTEAQQDRATALIFRMSPWARLTSEQLAEHIAAALAAESAPLIAKIAALEKRLSHSAYAAQVEALRKEQGRSKDLEKQLGDARAALKWAHNHALKAGCKGSLGQVFFDLIDVTLAQGTE